MNAAILALLAPLLFSATGCACSAETALQEVLGLSAEVPEFTGWKAVSTDTLEFYFSQPVSVKSVHLEPPVEIASVAGGREVRLFLAEPCSGGLKMAADLLVEDAYGNTLNVLTPFRSRNDNMPRLQINEVRTEYSKPRVEFIELYTLSAGNLGGMRLYITGGPEDPPFYEFPPVEVPAAQYIVLFLRTLDAAARDETGDDINPDSNKGVYEALATARDLWIPDSVKQLRTKGAAVYLVDQDDKVLDAVIFCESPAGWWTDEKLARAAEFLGEAGAWSGSSGAISPADAVSSVGATATRTLNRRSPAADSNSAADWYITVTSGTTPGKFNNGGVYVPK
jgi:hypothetical protein